MGYGGGDRVSVNLQRESSSDWRGSRKRAADLQVMILTYGQVVRNTPTVKDDHTVRLRQDRERIVRLQV